MRPAVWSPEMINSNELAMSQINTQEVLSHTAEGDEMEYTVGLEDT